MSVRHLTIEELAERLSVSVHTLYGWIQRGTGPAYIKVGGRIRYSLAAVEEWEREHTFGPEKRQ